jgi:hypothetical protein
MAHVAMQEADDHGQVVTWLEHVTDNEYAPADKVVGQRPVTAEPRHLDQPTESAIRVHVPCS